MAFIDEMMETASGRKVRVRVPSEQGGADRNVYIDGRTSGYYLGNGNNHVYKAGSYVAKTLRDLVENVLWENIKKRCIFCTSFFYCIFSKSYIIKYKIICNTKHVEERVSIKWHSIQFDRDTLHQDIEDILKERFTGDVLGKSLQDLYDPYLLKDMEKAVARIKQALQNKEKVIIFGDYDVDGVTSTSILMHFFKKIGLIASYRLPNRITDGYGMKSYFMDELAALWVTLVITVDCGTRDIDVVKYAKKLWIDVIITDHHAVPEEIPEEAVAIINPKRNDCEYPFKHLSGAGVALKVMMALGKELLSPKEYQSYLQETIDIAAVGTVADCMPLIDENRIIVLEWLKQLKKSRSVGLRKIIEEKMHEDLDADVFGFLIWPRLNAAWRLDSAYKAVNLILNNSDSIDDVIADIENINNKRKDLTRVFTQDAMDSISRKENVIFYWNSEIEHGIIGIVAWRLTETFHRPSIVLKDEWEKLVASCRSPEFFSIVEYLEKYKEYFLHFGWHKQAAWFSIAKEKFEEFREKFSRELAELDFSHHKKHFKVDKIIAPGEFSFRTLEKLKKFKPFGIGNEKPILMLQDFEIEKVEYLGKTLEHITLKNKDGLSLLGFWLWNHYDELKDKKKMSILFDFMEDTWMGKRQLKGKIIDIIL